MTPLIDTATGLLVKASLSDSKSLPFRSRTRRPFFYIEWLEPTLGLVWRVRDWPGLPEAPQLEGIWRRAAPL